MKRLMLTIFSGCLVAISFPPINAPFVVGLCGFGLGAYQVLHSRKPGLLGFIFGFSYFIILLKWMMVVGVDTWIGLAAICALWWALAFSLMAKLRMNSLWSVNASAIFTASELLRDRIPFGGFGWGQIGVLSAHSPLTSFVPLLGQVGMTFVICACVLECVRVWEYRTFPIRWYSGILICSVVLLPIANVGINRSSTHALDVALVQGGVVHTGLGTFGPARSVLQKHAEISLANRELLQQQDLVVWPESSSDLDPFLDLESNRIIHDVQSALGVPLLMGANVELPQNGIANDSILWNGSNSTIVYQKRRLVPFGEFLPFRETLSRYTDRVALMPRDFVAGDSPGSISIKGIRLSVVICFEIADDSLAFDGTKDSSAIIVHTNNATYQNLGQSEQQLMSAQMRALETQRPVFSVSTSGISAVIDTSGSISKSLSQAETGILVAHIEEVQGSTLAMLLHPIFVSGILLSALYLIFRILRTRRVTP